MHGVNHTASLGWYHSVEYAHTAYVPYYLALTRIVVQQTDTLLRAKPALCLGKGAR